ncbi:MAG: hypothetical protein GX638_16595 [Crenarchaeota archaeon]|nr:hypothetical protein [Thermoproteota archaeon]
MIRLRRHCIFLIFLFVMFSSLNMVQALPSSGFEEKNGSWYDDWGINRNYYGGRYGYLPDLAYQTLDENKELAFSIGESFRQNFTIKTERATAILKYVQKWTEYGYDEENVFMDGAAQEEWAWNADEMAHAIDETAGIKAVGDCEDLSFLCATIYKGAGFDVALVDAPDHVALLIWLPEFPNADNYWNIPDDNRGSGWIWVESTGSTNRLGWTPSEYDDGRWRAYPIGEIEPIPEEQKFSFELISLVIVPVVVILIFSVIKKSKSKKVDYSYLPPPPVPPPPPDF